MPQLPEAKFSLVGLVVYLFMALTSISLYFFCRTIILYLLIWFECEFVHSHSQRIFSVCFAFFCFILFLFFFSVWLENMGLFSYLNISFSSRLAYYSYIFISTSSTALNKLLFSSYIRYVHCECVTWRESRPQRILVDVCWLCGYRYRCFVALYVDSVFVFISFFLLISLCCSVRSYFFLHYTFGFKIFVYLCGAVVMDVCCRCCHNYAADQIVLFS